MKVLHDIVNQINTSKPVFVAELSADCDVVHFNLKNPRKFNTGPADDPVVQAVIESFKETFDSRKRRMIPAIMLRSVYNSMVDDVTSFYETHSSLKNPTKSTLYKWLSEMSWKEDHPASEGFISLYRYINSAQLNPRVVDNVITILEMMREKYEIK